MDPLSLRTSAGVPSSALFLSIIVRRTRSTRGIVKLRNEKLFAYDCCVQERMKILNFSLVGEIVRRLRDWTSE